MPSEYDEMNERAYPDYRRGTPESRQLRDLLRRAMEVEGFSIYPTEWWHFDYRDWPEYAVLDLSFCSGQLSQLHERNGAYRRYRKRFIG